MSESEPTPQQQELLTMLRESFGADVAVVVLAKNVSDDDDEMAHIQICNLHLSTHRIQLDNGNLIGLLMMAVDMCAISPLVSKVVDEEITT